MLRGTERRQRHSLYSSVFVLNSPGDASSRNKTSDWHASVTRGMNLGLGKRKEKKKYVEIVVVGGILHSCVEAITRTPSYRPSVAFTLRKHSTVCERVGEGGGERLGGEKKV